MKYKQTFLILAILATFTSCGEYWEGGDPNIRTMTLAKESIDLMVGDRYSIPVIFNPESLPNDAVWWTTEDEEIANFDDNSVVALNEGTTTAYAMSAIDRLQASCIVNVWPRWYANPNDYPYDMVIYANITVNGEPISDDVYVGAFIHGELRGVAERIERKGHKYTVIRVWSDSESGEIVFFRHYDPKTATMMKHDFWLPFYKYAFGSPSEPYDIELN